MAQSYLDRRGRSVRALAVDPRSNRIGFAYFEGALLNDCAAIEILGRRSAARILTLSRLAIDKLFDEHRPNVVVLPATGDGGFRRSPTVRAILEIAEAEARRRKMRVHFVGFAKVKSMMEAVRIGAGRSQYTRNQIIAEWFPIVADRLPRRRKIWQSEGWTTAMLTAIAMWCAWRGVPTRRKAGSDRRLGTA